MIATSLLLCLRFLLFFSFEVGSLLFFQNGKVWSWAGGFASSFLSPLFSRHLLSRLVNILMLLRKGRCDHCRRRAMTSQAGTFVLVVVLVVWSNSRAGSTRTLTKNAFLLCVCLRLPIILSPSSILLLQSSICGGHMRSSITMRAAPLLLLLCYNYSQQGLILHSARSKGS